MVLPENGLEFQIKMEIADILNYNAEDSKGLMEFQVVKWLSINIFTSTSPQ